MNKHIVISISILSFFGATRELSAEDPAALNKLPISGLVQHYVSATLSSESGEEFWADIARGSGGIRGGVITKTVLPLSGDDSTHFLILFSSTWKQFERGVGQGGEIYNFYYFAGDSYKNLDEVLEVKSLYAPLTLIGRALRGENYVYFAKAYPPRPVSTWVMEFCVKKGEFNCELANISSGPVTEKEWKDFFIKEQAVKWAELKSALTEEITLAELIRSETPHWHTSLDLNEAVAESNGLKIDEIRGWLKKIQARPK